MESQRQGKREDNVSGIFGDKGETGTNRKRCDFERMIARASRQAPRRELSQPRKVYLSRIVVEIAVSDTVTQIINSNGDLTTALCPNRQPEPAVRKSGQDWCAIQNKTTNSYIIEITI